MSLGVQTSALARRRGRAPRGDTPSWFTRLEWFLRYEEQLLDERHIPRPFDLDPCGHPEAPVSRELLRRGGLVYTERQDGLRQSWAGRVVFENPPYAEAALLAFGAKRLAELRHVHGLVSYLPVWSGQPWWQRYINPPFRAGVAELDFLPGRGRFGWPGNPHGLGGTQAMFPSVVVRWKPENMRKYRKLSQHEKGRGDDSA